MAEDGDDQIPENPGIKDLWRAMHGWKRDLKEEIQGVRSEMNARFDAVDGRFDNQDDQLEAVRKAVDNDMARHVDLVRVENKVNDVATDVRDLKGRVGKIQSRIDRAGVS